MKSKQLLVGLLCFCCGALLFGGNLLSSATAQDHGQPSPQEMQKMMDTWMKTMKPGPHHEHLAETAGKYDVTIKSWWGGPDSPANVSKGEATIEMILGGRWAKERMTAEMMMPGADGQMQKMDFEGLGLSGYDNYRKQYVSTWYDNMGTSLTTMTGSATPNAKRLVMYGTMDEPMLGVIGRHFKGVTIKNDDGTSVFEMYDLHAGENYKVMEITYKPK